jgi:hypothetical protein
MTSVRIQKFAVCDAGTIAIKFAVLLPVLAAVTGFTVDVARLRSEQLSLQHAVDAASLAAAKELSLSDRKYEDLPQIAKSVVETYVATSRAFDGATPQTETNVSPDKATVEVTATLPFRSFFEELLGVDFPDVRSQSVASVVGQPNICVLGLNPREVGTISLEHDARVTGKNCGVYSNSSDNNGIKAKNSARLTASVICSRGGRDGGPANFTPLPLLDCPSFDDPLLSRPEPVAGVCDPEMPTRITSEVSLAPGTYCGLEVEDGGHAELRDGIYIFKDGPLIIRDGGRLTGEEAGLFFTGEDATFTFEAGSSISLTAPTEGAMAGLLVFASRTQDSRNVYSILSDDARVMVGTIYIPVGELRVDATNPVADQSAYTAIVADKMRLYGGPHLVLNTNYSETNVPVPEGIRGAGQPAVLVR